MAEFACLSIRPLAARLMSCIVGGLTAADSSWQGRDPLRPRGRVVQPNRAAAGFSRLIGFDMGQSTYVSLSPASKARVRDEVRACAAPP